MEKRIKPKPLENISKTARWSLNATASDTMHKDTNGTEIHTSMKKIYEHPITELLSTQAMTNICTPSVPSISNDVFQAPFEGDIDDFNPNNT